MVFKETRIGKSFDNASAQKLVAKCMRYDSEIILEMGTKKINGKSLMGVISLNFKKGDSVTVIAKGDDQDEALESAVKILASAQ